MDALDVEPSKEYPKDMPNKSRYQKCKFLWLFFKALSAFSLATLAAGSLGIADDAMICCIL